MISNEFGSKNLELLKQKDAYSYEYMDSFKRFDEEKLPDKKCFYSSVKDGTTADNGEKLDGDISDKDYLTVCSYHVSTCFRVSPHSIVV